jgi:hypothetical protein
MDLVIVREMLSHHDTDPAHRTAQRGYPTADVRLTRDTRTLRGE